MKKIFDKIIERLEEEVCYQQKCHDGVKGVNRTTITQARQKMKECYEHAIEIVREVAEEYTEVPNLSENLTSSDEYCEWKLDGVYLHCQHKTDLIITCLEDEKYRYSFCPYCGKEIKVVE